MKKIVTLSAVFCAAFAFSGLALADDTGAIKIPSGAMGAAKATDTAMTDAVIKKIDPATGMVTIKHGEFANIGMPAMTMAYKAKDAAMLKNVKEGDAVKVRVENVNGVLTVVKLAKQ